MKQSLLVVGMAAALMIGWSIGRVQAQQASRVVFASPDQAKFTEVGKGTSMAPIWGDANMEAHATYTKFEPGFDAGMHTHTKMTRVRSASVPAISYVYPEVTSIGAAAISKKAPCSMRRDRGSLI
jgi:hypothetical protein